MKPADKPRDDKGILDVRKTNVPRGTFSFFIEKYSFSAYSLIFKDKYLT
jgi:hypothetical protein